MKRTFTLLAAMTAATFSFGQNFTAGNLLVFKAGNGTDPLSNTGSPAFLVEYSPTGTLVQTVALPTAASGENKIFVTNGTATTEGFIMRSPSGVYVTAAGYSRALGGTGNLNASTGTDVPRVIAKVTYDKTVNTATSFTDFVSGGNPRSVITVDGNRFWMAGGSNGGVYYGETGGSAVKISDTSSNLRVVGIEDNQLYVSSGAGSIRLVKVGTGVPTTASQSVVNLPGVPNVGSSPYQFVFLDLDANVPGPDVLYLASDNASALQKFSLVNGEWVLNGTVGVAADAYRGLVGEVLPTGGVMLYATRKATELVSINDNSGYNGAFAAEPTLLATAEANEAFRGVSFTPLETALPLSLLSFTASKTNNGNLLVWTTNKEYNAASFELQKSVDGSTYRTISTQRANGSDLYNEYSVTDREASTGIAYYRLKMIDKNGEIKYSNIVKMANLSATKFTITPNPADGFINIAHGLIKGKATVRIVTMDGRQMAAYPVPDGSYQTSLNISNIQAGVYRVVFENGGNKASSLIIKK